jgi:hypothetical protein
MSKRKHSSSHNVFVINAARETGREKEELEALTTVEEKRKKLDKLYASWGAPAFKRIRAQRKTLQQHKISQNELSELFFDPGGKLLPHILQILDLSGINISFSDQEENRFQGKIYNPDSPTFEKGAWTDEEVDLMRKLFIQVHKVYKKNKLLDVDKERLVFLNLLFGGVTHQDLHSDHTVQTPKGNPLSEEEKEKMVANK